MQHLIFISAIIIFGLNLTVTAQQQRQYYLKGGWTYTLPLKSLPEAQSAGGSSLGVGAKYPLRGHWYLQPELVYERYNLLMGTNNSERRYRFQYLALPLALTYRRSDLLELYGGIQLGLMFRALSFPTDDPANIRTYNKDDFSSFQVWPLIGMEVNMSPINLGLRYFYNPLKFASSDQATTELGDIRLHGFQLYGALAF